LGFSRCKKTLLVPGFLEQIHSDPAAVLRKQALASLNSMIGIPSGIQHNKLALIALPPLINLLINPLINP
jgi:hypothetical protein